MKLPILLFSLGLLGLASTDYFATLKPAHELQAAKEEYPEVQDFLAEIDIVYDGTADPVVTRTLSLREINSVKVYPGFRIVHDPNLSREIMVTAPEGAFALLNLSSQAGLLDPDFTRPVRLRELVEVRVNLHAQGNKHMEIFVLAAPEGRTDLQPDFVTDGPLSFDLLQLINLPAHRIDIDSRDVVVTYPQATKAKLHGEAQRLEFLYRGADVDAPAEVIVEPNLQAKEIYRTEVGTSLADKLRRLSKSANNEDPEIPQDSLGAIADTTIIK